jgi:hypothetical protein
MRRFLLSKPDDSPLRRDDRSTSAIVNSELCEDVLHVALNRLFADRENIRNFFISISACHQGQNLYFPRSSSTQLTTLPPIPCCSPYSEKLSVRGSNLSKPFCVPAHNVPAWSKETEFTRLSLRLCGSSGRWL